MNVANEMEMPSIIPGIIKNNNPPITIHRISAPIHKNEGRIDSACLSDVLTEVVCSLTTAVASAAEHTIESRSHTKGSILSSHIIHDGSAYMYILGMYAEKNESDSSIEKSISMAKSDVATERTRKRRIRFLKIVIERCIKSRMLGKALLDVVGKESDCGNDDIVCQYLMIVLTYYHFL